MHRPKSYHMTRTCRHHMLLVGGVGFYSKITFLTPISRSKVIRRSKSCDMVRQGQWSLWPSLVMISHVMTEVHVQTWLTERRRRICLWQNKTPVGGLVTSHAYMAHKTPQQTQNVSETFWILSFRNVSETLFVDYFLRLKNVSGFCETLFKRFKNFLIKKRK